MTFTEVAHVTLYTCTKIAPNWCQIWLPGLIGDTGDTTLVDVGGGVTVSIWDQPHSGVNVELACTHFAL